MGVRLGIGHKERTGTEDESGNGIDSGSMENADQVKGRPLEDGIPDDWISTHVSCVNFDQIHVHSYAAYKRREDSCRSDRQKGQGLPGGP